MSSRSGIAALALLASAAIGGCRLSTAPREAEAFLKWSMDRYYTTKHFHASVRLRATSSREKPLEMNRVIDYAAPNRFAISATTANTQINCVSDGTRMVEFSSNPKVEATEYLAPVDIARSDSSAMQQPLQLGTLLFQFFGGSANIDNLVKPGAGPVQYAGEPVTIGGEKSRVVRFKGQLNYGDVKVAIGEESGLVKQITYDAAPLVDMLQRAVTRLDSGKGQDPAAARQLKDRLAQVEGLSVTESYTALSEGNDGSSSFSTQLGPRYRVRDLAVQTKNAEPPLTRGSDAPDVTFLQMDGTPLRLSSLKGHPVLIDFWATWCGPCRLGLPFTAELSRRGTPLGLKVIAASDESKSVVTSFLAKQPYSLSPLLDPGDSGQVAFRVSGLPSEVILDSRGRIVDYFVGLHSKDDVLRALKRADAMLSKL